MPQDQYVRVKDEYHYVNRKKPKNQDAPLIDLSVSAPHYEYVLNPTVLG